MLENDIVQTIGSAGESLAGGVVFTMLTFAGGILSVLMWYLCGAPSS